MAEIEFSDNDLVIFDGRQSETAAAIQRGTGRMLREAGFAWIPELPLVTGRRVDIIAVNQAGLISVIEIKSSVADFRADNKWHEYREFCDRLYFAVMPDLPQEILPGDLIAGDRFNIFHEGPSNSYLLLDDPESVPEKDVSKAPELKWKIVSL